MTTGAYIVRKPFKYGAKQFNAGDEWEPGGGRWDRQIISHYVKFEPAREDKKRAERKSKHAS